MKTQWLWESKTELAIKMIAFKLFVFACTLGIFFYVVYVSTHIVFYVASQYKTLAVCHE